MRYKIISEIYAKTYEFVTFEGFSCALSNQLFFARVPKLVVFVEEDGFDCVYKISYA